MSSAPSAIRFKPAQPNSSSSYEPIEPLVRHYEMYCVADGATGIVENMATVLVYSVDFDGDDNADEQLIYRRQWQLLEDQSVQLVTHVLFPSENIIDAQGIKPSAAEALLKSQDLATNLFTIIHEKTESVNAMPTRGALNARSLHEQSGLIFGYYDEEMTEDESEQRVLTLDFCYENQWFVYHQE